MAYTPHLYVSWGGRLTADEEWQVGIRMTANNWPQPDYVHRQAEDHVADVAAVISTFHSGQIVAGEQAFLDWVKCQPLDADGHYYPGQVTVEWLAADNGGAVAGIGTTAYPLQIARVLSLTTDAPRGRAAKGRIYYPTAIPVGASDRRTFASDATTAAAQFVTLINGLNAVPWEAEWTSPPEVAVVSAIDASWRPVTGVKVGRVLDTQRRRRNDLAEDYSAAALS